MNDHHERSGTEQDCMKLKLLFEKLGFVVCVKEDLKRHVSHLGEFYSPPPGPCKQKLQGMIYNKYIRITIMSLFMCASRDLSYIQLLNPVHNFLLKKKTSESYFYKGCLINSLSPLQEKITFFSDCDFNLLHSNKQLKLQSALTLRKSFTHYSQSFYILQ